MKTLVKVLYWLAGIVLLLVVVAFLLPKTYKVERNIYVRSNPAVIYGLTSNFAQWHLWVPWTKELDSTAVFEMKGGVGQVGTSWTWNGKKLGQGEMVSSELIPGQLVAYDLAFDHGKYKSKGKIVISQLGDSCQVSWIDEGDLGYNPMSRYMGLFMGKMMGPDFEKGLAKLKSVAEARAGWPKIEEIVMKGQVALIVRDSAGPKTYSDVMDRAYGELMTFIQINRLKATGPPFAIYLKWDSVTMFSVMDLGIPVEKAEKAKGRIRIENLQEQNAVAAHYFGAYEKTAGTYRILDQYVREAGKETAGGPWEIYVTDPMSEKDTAKWETTIVFPVK
jgi:effector-binding domain-containing protein